MRVQRSVWACVHLETLPVTLHPPRPCTARREKPREAAPCRPERAGRPHLALMRYWARLMLAGVPVMVIWRSDDPSVALAILI